MDAAAVRMRAGPGTAATTARPKRVRALQIKPRKKSYSGYFCFMVRILQVCVYYIRKNQSVRIVIFGVPTASKTKKIRRGYFVCRGHCSAGRGSDGPACVALAAPH